MIAPYVSLWARMREFDRDSLDIALYEEHTVVRIPWLYGRLYLILAENYPVSYQAIKPLQRRALGAWGEFVSDPGHWSAVSQDRLRIESLSQRVLEVMSTRGPSTISELTELLPELAMCEDPGRHPELGNAKLGRRLIPGMCAEGVLVRARPRGGWRSEEYTYSSVSSWLPTVDLASVSPEQALRAVVRNYISYYGPVTAGDVNYWLGGFQRRQIGSVLMGLDSELAHIQLDGSSSDFVMLTEQVDDLAQCATEGRCALLLPPHDGYTMAYSDMGRLTREPYKERVLDRTGETVGTVWADGYIVGTWWLNVREGHVFVRFFEVVAPDVLATVGEEARRLAADLDFDAFDLDIDVDRGDEVEGTEERVSVTMPPAGRT